VRASATASRASAWPDEEPRDRLEFVHVCIDDFTRLAYVEVLEDELGITAVGFLRRARLVRGAGCNRRASDDGTTACYRRKTSPPPWPSSGPSTPGTALHARTNGKAERFHQT